MAEENMKANNAQQEILLVMETNFSSMLWSESNPSSFARFISENDYIEDACWNNILSEVLPELSQMQCPKQDLYLGRSGHVIIPLNFVLRNLFSSGITI